MCRILITGDAQKRSGSNGFCNNSMNISLCFLHWHHKKQRSNFDFYFLSLFGSFIFFNKFLGSIVFKIHNDYFMVAGSGLLIRCKISLPPILLSFNKIMGNAQINSPTYSRVRNTFQHILNISLSFFEIIGL